MSVGAVARDLERDRPRQTLTGFLALTFGTLLSSQGSGAHQDQAFRPGLGATALTYLGGLRVSNSLPALHPAREAPPRPEPRRVSRVVWPPRERPPSGVRHSLPGDVENTRQVLRRSANRLVSGLRRGGGPSRGAGAGAGSGRRTAPSMARSERLRTGRSASADPPSAGRTAFSDTSE